MSVVVWRVRSVCVAAVPVVCFRPPGVHASFVTHDIYAYTVVPTASRTPPAPRRRSADVLQVHLVYNLTLSGTEKNR